MSDVLIVNSPAMKPVTDLLRELAGADLAAARIEVKDYRQVRVSYRKAITEAGADNPWESVLVKYDTYKHPISAYLCECFGERIASATIEIEADSLVVARLEHTMPKTAADVLGQVVRDAIEQNAVEQGGAVQ